MDSERTLAGPQPTGDSRVDEAIAQLAPLLELPLDEHPPVLEAVHDRLREILGELGDTGGPARPAEPGRPGRQGELGGHAAFGQPGRQGGSPHGGGTYR